MQKPSFRADGAAASVLSMIVATAYFFSIFPGLKFVGGVSSYWQNQIEDVTQYMAGMQAFRSAPWGMPLLHINSINWPEGTSVAFSDAIPLLAVVVKATSPIWPENPFGLWVFACFLLSGCASWWAVRQARGGWVELFLTLVLCVQMPALLNRLGHLSLMAQFLIIFAIGIYFRDRLREAPSWQHWAALLTAAFYVNFYLTAMVATIMIASAIDAALSGRLRLVWKYGLSFLPIVATFPIMYGSGFGTSVKEGGYDFFSMNVLSPLVGGSIIQLPSYVPGTIGQYEGFNYLGLGILVPAVLFCFFKLRVDRKLIGPALWAACAGLSVYALSNVIYFSHWMIIRWDVPSVLAPLTETFRGSGRFFWPVAYVLAFYVALSVGTFRARLGVFICVAIALLQWSDLRDLRHQARDTARRGAAELLDKSEWGAALANVDTVYFYPKFRCGKASNREILPFQILSAQLGKNLTTGYIARYAPDCSQDLNEIANADSGRSAFLFAMTDYDLASAQDKAPATVVCKQQEIWIFCR